MSKWERFQLAWTFFWWGVLFGVAAVVFATWGIARAPFWFGPWCAFSWIIPYLPTFAEGVTKLKHRSARIQDAA